MHAASRPLILLHSSNRPIFARGDGPPCMGRISPPETARIARLQAAAILFFWAVLRKRTNGGISCRSETEHRLNSSLISTVEKSRRYAEEPDRVRFQEFEVVVRGENAEHLVTMRGTEFTDTSHSFQTLGTSSHIMALQKILAPMLTDDQQTAGAPFSFCPPASARVSHDAQPRTHAAGADRLTLQPLNCAQPGGHAGHPLTLQGAELHCDCHGFQNHGTCTHVMALQKILADMLTEDQRTAGQPFSFSGAAEAPETHNPRPPSAAARATAPRLLLHH